MFAFLEKFEAEAITSAAQMPGISAPKQTPKINPKTFKSEGLPKVSTSVRKIFGMSKEEKIDVWMNMSNAELQLECQKFGLPSKDS